MKKILIASLISASFSISAFATDFTDYATIKRVEPQYTSVNQPTQKCTVQTIQETIPGRQDKSYGGAVVGGLAGGIIGNQIGKGHGKEAATAIGAVVGALAGDNLDNRDSYVPPQTTTRDVQRCYMEDNYVQKANGYKVTYEYKGKIDTFMSPVPPSDNRLRVSVSVRPYIDSYVPPSPNSYQNSYPTPSYEPYPSR